MEVFKDLKNSPKNKEFANLLSKQFEKEYIREGKVYKGTITKINPKICWVELESAKSEGTLGDEEIKILKEEGLLNLNQTINVMVVKLESKSGDLVISFDRARKLDKWNVLLKAYQEKKEVTGRIVSRIKGGYCCSINGALAFLPSSQVALTQLKNNELNQLMKEPQRFLVVKADELRGNVVVSRRAILETIQNASKEEILKKYKVGQIVEGTCKNIVPYGCFFDLDGEVDVLCHINEISYSRINHPNELFEIGQRFVKLKIIGIDKDTKRISVSCKQVKPDPFATKIDSYKEGQIVHNCVVERVMEYGAFVALEDSLQGLVHSTHCSYKKNISPRKILSVSQKVSCKILSIQKDQRRISLSIKDCLSNPWDEFEKKFEINSDIPTTITDISDYAIHTNIKGHEELAAIIHKDDLAWSEKEQDLKKFKKGEEITAKLLTFNRDKELIRLGLKQKLPDPLDYFKDKVNEILTVKILETEENGLIVTAIGCPDLKILIKKNNLSMHKEDCRVSRFNPGDRIDSILTELNLKRRKIALSIKALELRQTEDAIKKFGSVSSGRALPFADLSNTLKKKDKKIIQKKSKKEEK